MLMDLPNSQIWHAKLILIIFTLNSIERDAQLLANRIALLKQEEMKTWKKIEETKKRAGDVQRLKHKNEERAHKKMYMEMQEQQRQEHHRANV